MDGRHSRSDIDRYVKAFDDGTIPDTETLYRVRWRMVTADQRNLVNCPLPDQQIQDSRTKLKIKVELLLIACERISIMEFRCLYLTLEIDSFVE